MILFNNRKNELITRIIRNKQINRARIRDEDPRLSEIQ